MSASNILVCVDGSDYTEPSLLHAAWLGEQVGASRLIVSHIADVGKYLVPFVNELGAGIGLQPCNGLFSEIHKQEQDLLGALEARIAKTLESANWANRYEFVVERGRPPEALQSSGASYSHVVFGKRGESFSYDQEHLGSNLGKFLKHAAVPCLLSSRKYEEIRKVALVCTQTQEWESVVRFAEQATWMGQPQIQLIHSFQGELPKPLEQLQSKLKASGVRCDLCELQIGDDSSIIDRVCALEANLLVIGAHCESHFMHWLATPLGKTIIKSCRIPILVCRR